MIDENNQEPQVVDLGTFINLITEWHANKAAFLNHLKAVPAGVTMTLNDEEEITLEGDFLKGFQYAMGIALAELGPCPISRGIISEIPDAIGLNTSGISVEVSSTGEGNDTIH